MGHRSITICDVCERELAKGETFADFQIQRCVIEVCSPCIEKGLTVKTLLERVDAIDRKMPDR